MIDDYVSHAHDLGPSIMRDTYFRLYLSILRNCEACNPMYNPQT